MDKNKKQSFLNFFNARRGFATNSSSSHSMLLLDNTNKKVSDEYNSSEFGWDFFTLSQQSSKKKYLASLIGSSLEHNFGSKITSQILLDLGLVESIDDKLIPIDHQSRFNMPLSSDGSSANTQFIKEFVSWALKPEVVILGGNDNTDHAHPLSSKGLEVEIDSWIGYKKITAHKDEENNTWSLFSRENGLTLRFSFDDVSLAQENFVKNDKYRQSNAPLSRPNLVDIKITDSCPYKCEYCYQSSTPNAPHAPFSKIVSIAQSLASENVFEVALGGGETTLHPNFEDIIEEFHKRGVVPNITTRNLSWVQNPSSLESLSKIGAFAISIDSVKSTKKALKAIAKMDENILNSSPNTSSLHSRRIYANSNFQIVIGTQTEEEFKEMLDLIWTDDLNNKITFLGYKDVGFGNDFIKDPHFEKQINHANENWLDWVKEANAKAKLHHNYNQSRSYFWIAVDTALAQISEEKLRNESENKGKSMYHTVEGSQSMYIDAVKNTMAPSSFAHPSQSIEFNENKWLDSFKSFSKPKTKKIGLKLK